MRSKAPYPLTVVLTCLVAAAGSLATEKLLAAEGKQPVAAQQPDAEKSRQRGVEYCKQGQWSKAIGELDEAIRLKPHDASAYGYRAAAYFASGQIDNAINDFSRQVQLEPTNSSGYFNRGSAYRTKRDFHKAITDFNRCLKLTPTDALAYKSRAAVYEAMGEFDKAISDCNEGLRLSPGDALAHAMRGRAYSGKGQFGAALRDFRKAIQLDPKNDQGYNNLAWLRATCPVAAMRSAAEALEAGEKACELTNWSSWSRVDTLAAAFAEAGNFTKAADYQRQAMRMSGPTHQEIQEMADRLLLYEERRPYREQRRRSNERNVK